MVHKEVIVPMEDAMEALLAQLVQPLLPSKMVPHPPSISQQQAVAKQMHAVVLLYNYYHRLQCPEIEFLPFDSLCKSATISNNPLVGYLGKTGLVSENLSLAEESIMRACNIAMSLFDNGTGSIEMWPIEKVAVFLADAKREKCFLEKDTLVEGVFSLMEAKVEGQKDEDVLEKFALSTVESRTGITRTSMRTWYSRQTYSLSKEKSRTVVFLVECSKPPPVDKGFVEVPIKDVLNNLKGPLISSDSKSLTPVVGFFLLLPYGDIISDWLSKPTSELDKELGKRLVKEAKSNNKSSMNIDTKQVQVKREPSSRSLEGKNQNENNKPDKKRDHATFIYAPPSNISAKHMNSIVGPSDNYSVKNATSIGQLSNNGSQKPVKLGVEGGHNRRENGTVKQIAKDVRQEIGNTKMELIQVNSMLCTPTKMPANKTSYVKQEMVPFVMKDFPSCLHRLNKIRDDLCDNQRKLEDKIAQCEMDIQTIICEGQMASQVEEIAERWKNAIPCEGYLNLFVACTNQNKKKKFKLRSSCQQLDDTCRDNNLPLPRYNVHPISNEFYVAIATLKNGEMDCMAKSDLKKNPHEAREHAAFCLMQKLSEMDED